MRGIMKMKGNLWLSITAGILLLCLFLLLIGRGRKLQELKVMNVQQTKTIAEFQQGKKEQEKKYDELMEKYQKAYQAKQGFANKQLNQTVDSFFSTVYTYESNEIEGVLKRKEEAEKLADSAVCQSFFPDKKENAKPSVQVQSQLVGRPEVYFESSNSDIIQTLVLVTYQMIVADIKQTEISELYKVVYQPVKNKIVRIDRLGEISKNQME